MKRLRIRASLWAAILSAWVLVPTSVSLADGIRYDSAPLGIEFDVQPDWTLRHIKYDADEHSHTFAILSPSNDSYLTIVVKVYEQNTNTLADFHQSQIRKDWRESDLMEMDHLKRSTPNLKEMKISYFKSDDIDARNILLVSSVSHEQGNANRYSFIALWNSESKKGRAMRVFRSFLTSVEFDGIQSRKDAESES